MTTRNEPARTITATAGGPFVCGDELSIRTADYVWSEKGEPLTWQFGSPRQIESGTALCRCGESSDKPFCDGSHAEHEWDATSSPPAGSYAERALPKQGTKLTVTDDPSLCVHAGLCGTERATVWSLMSETNDTDTRATVIRMVEKCPSGRLVNIVDGDVVEPALPAGVGVIPDGPLWLTGNVTVRMDDGTELEVRNRVTLCRCGASASKPLCDGSHVDVDFEAGGLGSAD
ncbi:MAG: CDGSH iron-sulfur domain-containing protein [Acidimicrobiales bacterium]